MKARDEALVVVDIQNDFCPGGALAVAGGDQIIDGLNRLMDDFACVVLTQDWHPPDHASFAANQPGQSPGATVTLDYGPQVLWPVHCVQGSPGAAFHPRLRTDPAQLILRKGFRAAIDSYSAFFENDRTTATGLDGWLRDRGIRHLTLAGLATDFCVAFSALDAARLGYGVTLREDLSRPIDLDGSLATRQAALRAAGVILR